MTITLIRTVKIVSADEARRRVGLDLKWKGWLARAEQMNGCLSFDDEEMAAAYKYFAAGFSPFEFLEAMIAEAQA